MLLCYWVIVRLRNMDETLTLETRYRILRWKDLRGNYHATLCSDAWVTVPDFTTEEKVA